MLLSLLKAGTGIRALKKDINQYDQIILCGPIWAGFLCSPLLDFIKKHKNRVNHFHFATCCASDDKQRDDKFGYARVFQQIRAIAGGKCVHCEAFPLTLALPEDKRNDSNEVIKTKLSDANFGNELIERLERFVKKVTE